MTGDQRDLIARLAAELEQLADWQCFHGGFRHCDNPDCVRRRQLLTMARVAAPVIVCGGRALDDQDHPTGEPCGRVFNARKANGDGAVILGMARAAGWKLGPLLVDGIREAICPRCAKPNPAVVKLAAELTASITERPADA